MVVDVTESKRILIGEIDFSGCDIIDEGSQIESEKNKKPNLTGLGICSIYVNNVEGTIPHVHVVNTDGFGTCICLHDALYFPHGNDPLTKDIFNSKQRKEFNKWMGNPNISGNPGLSNFEYAAYLWSDFFKNSKEDIDALNSTYRITTQPNYSFMKGDVNPNLR